jgi:type III pantothenate kinase
MNLIIDVGNTFVKLAVFQDAILKDKSVTSLDKFEASFKKILKTFPKLQKCIIASVGKLEKEHKDLVISSIETLVLSADTKLPFNNLYKTPKTLGVDRIALVCASVEQFPYKNCLIIDAGTCITYDFINKKNDYLGGAISPGIRLRYITLHNLTANLPLLETELPENITGNSTSSAIHSGVVNGILKEIDGLIGDYQNRYSDLTVILTGGDANFLSKQLKSSIFANSNFLLEGLNFILEHNTH